MSGLHKLLLSERGYSLIELLTVMLILSTILGGLTQLFVSGSNAELDTNRRFQAQQSARVALDRMRRDIHCSSAAYKPTSGTLLVLADPCVGTSTTLAASTSFGATNIKVASVSGLAAGDHVTVDTGSGAETRAISSVGTAGAGGTGVTVATAFNMVHIAAATVTDDDLSWCTVSKSGPAGTTWYSLYRKLGGSCDATGSDYADSLVNSGGSVFTYAQQSTSSLASVAVDIKVNLKPSMPQSTYELSDSIVLRNSSRTCVLDSVSTFGSPSPPC